VTLDLGGPGVGCSAMRVRRLLADELAGSERERTQSHVAECSRCQKTVRELEEESLALRRDLPFPAFAAGVAEKLARQRRPGFAQWTAFAAAAAALIVAGAVVLRPSDSGQATQRPAETERSKGGSIAQLFMLDGQGTRALAAGEKISSGSKLRLILHPGARKYAAAVLLEPGEASVLYDGPALNGALPEAFEWTGAAREAQLLVVLSDSAIDAAKLHGAGDAPRGADVTELALRR
jgi:hypothetical protein